MSETFTAIDGNSYECDRWYDLPFLFAGKSMVPTLDEPCFVRLEDGSIYLWRPWSMYPKKKTQWMVKSK